MNARERYLAVAHFEKPDKVPISIGDIRKDVMKRWWTEGMPKDVDPWVYFGFDVGSSEGAYTSGVYISSFPQTGGWGLNPNAVNLGPLPPFGRKILHENERYRIWIDELGITQKGFREDWEEGWSGFATRVFMDFPVKTRHDFVEMKKRYNPKNSRRYPKQWEELKRKWKERSYPIGFLLRGPFSFVRDLMGLHQMMIEFHRNPEFIHEIMDFCTEFHIVALQKAVEEVEVDFTWITEDMAYKKGPMISPKMVCDFMLPCYERLTKFLLKHGIDIINIDSDGNVVLLVPPWLKAGINGVGPCEVAAGVDIVALRKKYPRLIIHGGIDKRKLAESKKAIKEEIISKVPYMIKKGGYFPGVDHAVPSDVPLDNYKYFTKLLGEICGWI